ncbi:MAG: iron ABC transporter permease, partial [Clostridia bacterium]|nr:iron ABC transporter permease [Clostridia bacterium]
MTRPVQKLVRPATLRSRWSALLVLLALLTILSLLVGRFPIDWRLLLTGPTAHTDPSSTSQVAMTRSVLFNLRLPRTLVALYGGFGLALVGSVLQTIFKNPLASPDIMGVSSGASVGAAAAILFLGSGVLPVTLGAFAGGLLAVALAIFLAQSGSQRQLATFVVSGLAVNALAQALLMLLKLVADP